MTLLNMQSKARFYLLLPLVSRLKSTDDLSLLLEMGLEGAVSRSSLSSSSQLLREVLRRAAEERKTKTNKMLAFTHKKFSYSAEDPAFQDSWWLEPITRALLPSQEQGADIRRSCVLSALPPCLLPTVLASFMSAMPMKGNLDGRAEFLGPVMGVLKEVLARGTQEDKASPFVVEAGTSCSCRFALLSSSV